MSAIEITCSDLTELVTDYLEGALAPPRHLSFETHVVYCGDCMTFLAQIRETVERLHALPRERIDGDEKQVLLDAFRAQ